MYIWLDMANSPHPVLLAPVARELVDRGHELVVTCRDHAQTRELTLREWDDAVAVGGESPPGRAAKARNIAERVIGLRKAVRHARPRAAVSLGSYAQILAARSLGCRVLTMMDYEHQPANHLSFRLAHRVVVPTVFPEDRLRHYGATRTRVRKFDGFKEEMYLDQQHPSQSGWDVPSGHTLAVFRPAPEGALYHREENAQFDRLLSEATTHPHVVAVVLPRIGRQHDRYAGMPGVQVPRQAVPGVELLRKADVFVGAGGTMSREAALLGARAYTIFAGRPSAVDAKLIEQGSLNDLRGSAARAIDWSPRSAEADSRRRELLAARAASLRRWLVEQIEAVA